MRHKNVNKTLGREKGPRKSLFRATATNLFNYESIKTTLAKAKAMRSYVEKIITKAKNGSLHDRREVLREVHDKTVVKKLFDDVAKRVVSRNGGYTRIIKVGPRPNDGAEMAVFELVDKVEKPISKKQAKEETKSKLVEKKEKVSEEKVEKKTTAKKSTESKK